MRELDVVFASRHSLFSGFEIGTIMLVLIMPSLQAVKPAPR
jgi:hypothetical protein